MRTVRATRYLTPLREGGSVPAIVEADDSGTYVVKFRGAAQGVRALIAEAIGGELARVLGLPVPQVVAIDVDVVLARSEPDPEIQDDPEGERRASTSRSTTCRVRSTGSRRCRASMPRSRRASCGSTR